MSLHGCGSVYHDISRVTAQHKLFVTQMPSILSCVHALATMVCIKKKDPINIFSSFQAAISISQRVKLYSQVCHTDSL